MIENFMILDCSFRDGGYYTSWKFRAESVLQWLVALKRSGVEIAELGLRTPNGTNSFGIHAFTPPWLLRDLEANAPDLAVMINAKEFAKDSDIQMEKMFPDVGSRELRLVRIATRLDSIHLALTLGKWLKNRGTEFSVNLQDMAKTPVSSVIPLLDAIEDSGARYLYFADTSGSLDPWQVEEYFNSASSNTSLQLGFHGHNNMGLALANSMSAIRSGARIVDGTGFGIGRGAGNTKTEELVFTRDQGIIKDSTLDLDFAVNSVFSELRERHKWGVDPMYFLGGMNQVHPDRVQDLLQNTSLSRGAVLNEVGSEVQSTRKFERDNPPQRGLPELSSEQLHRLHDVIVGREVLLIGSGKSAGELSGDLMRIAEKNRWIAIRTGDHSHGDLDVLARMLSVDAAKAFIQKGFVTKEVALVGGHLELQGGIHGDNFFMLGSLSLPEPPKSSATVGLQFLLQARPSKVFLVGFDGYPPGVEVHAEIVSALSKCSDQGIEVVSFSDSTFDTRRESLYFYEY